MPWPEKNSPPLLPGHRPMLYIPAHPSLSSFLLMSTLLHRIISIVNVLRWAPYQSYRISNLADDTCPRRSRVNALYSQMYSHCSQLPVREWWWSRPFLIMASVDRDWWALMENWQVPFFCFVMCIRNEPWMLLPAVSSGFTQQVGICTLVKLMKFVFTSRSFVVHNSMIIFVTPVLI